MYNTIPQQPPTRRWHPTWHDINYEMLTAESQHTELELRITALEEALVSRRARRRPRREIRAAAKAYAWVGSFAAARWEAATYTWLNRPGPRPVPPAPIPGDDE